MSRTFNQTSHDFRKGDYKVEYPNGYKMKYPGGDVEYEPNKEYDYDVSHTTLDADNMTPWQRCTRHPNKKRRTGVLTREFHKLGVNDPSGWKNRFGDAYDKSSRTHLSRAEMAHRRRHRFKEQTRNIINEAYEDNL